MNCYKLIINKSTRLILDKCKNILNEEKVFCNEKSDFKLN